MTVLQQQMLPLSADEGHGGPEAATLRRLGRALDDLSAITSIDQLVERAPVALCKVGFDRAMISRIHDSEWVVERFYSAIDPDEAAEITAAARSANDRLDPNVIELEMVRRRVPLLVADAKREPRVNPRLAAMVNPSSYVAAPIAPDGEVVGFLHADRLTGPPVTAFDREMLALFAQEFAKLVATASLHARLERLRATVENLRSSLGGIVSSCLEGPVGLLPQRFDTETASVPAVQPITLHGVTGAPEIDRLLSEREREVLRLMALGETNGRIASRLVITEGTVKSHVRHILRKLNAANRAEAVCRWLQRPDHTR